ncbi:DUF2946 family protein [Lysobacter terrae]
MRHPRFQLRMSLLALTAVLLLVLVPTVGRVLSASADGARDGIWAQMCTLAGLKLVKIAPDDAGSAAPKPIGGSGHADCDYCPLLNAMAALVLWVVFAFARAADSVLPWRSPPARLVRRYPCGLGSRGPPLAC